MLNFGVFKFLQRFKRIIKPVSISGNGNRVCCNCQTSKRLDYHITIIGNNNEVKIASTCQLYSTEIVIMGNDNKLVLEDEVKIQEGKIEITNGATVHIGHNSTFQEVCITATEENVTIGADCLFSYGIIIRNYDGHKIVDTLTGEICNPPKKITLSDHVWISQNVMILKNVIIGENSIVGASAVVTRSLPSNCIAAGAPAKVVKENRNWLRH